MPPLKNAIALHVFSLLLCTVKKKTMDTGPSSHQQFYKFS